MDDAAPHFRAMSLRDILNLPACLGVTWKLVLYMLVVAAVPVALIAIVAFRAGADGITRHTDLHLKSVVSIIGQEAASWTKLQEATGKTIASDRRILDAVNAVMHGPPTAISIPSASLKQYANGALTSNPSIIRISVYSLDGSIELFSFSRDAVESPVSPTLPETLPASQSRITLAPFVSGAEPAAALVESSILADGHPVGRLVLVVSTRSLMAALTVDSELGANGQVYLVDAVGTVLSPVRVVSDGAFSVTATEAMAAAQGETDDGLRYDGLLGRPVVGQYTPVAETPWTVVAEIPIADAFSDIGEMRIAIFVAVGLLTLLIFAAATLISRRLTRPLSDLATAAGQLGRGNLSHRIEIAGRDELSRLAKSFNRMAADLDSAQRRAIEAERAASLQTFTEQKVEQLSRLSQLGLSISSESSIARLAGAYPETIRLAASACAACVVILDMDGNPQVHVSACSEFDPLAESMLQNDPRLQWIRYGVAETHRESDEHTLTPSAAGNGSTFAHVMADPIRDESGGLVGAVIIANTGDDSPFNDEDAELVRIIAGYFSTSVQKMWKAENLLESEHRAVQALDELKDAQDQLLHSQKMESIGRLTGGIAHDFNNLLTPIIGFAELSYVSVPPEQTKLRRRLAQIQKTGEKAADLVAQLMTFSRSQVIEPEIIDMNGIIETMDRMLRSVLGEDIWLQSLPAPDLSNVEIAPSQAEQVLMNLVVNARDAMPLGGSLSIVTENVTLDEEYTRHQPDAAPGDYVLLTVTDTGSGIPEEVAARMFEPFYTTKPEGSGTGLGLATCHGIVTQRGGHITVSSQVGAGSTFRVYLPTVSTREQSNQDPERKLKVVGGTETILLVEDEKGVRELTIEVLSALGYTVASASEGEEAIKIADSMAPGSIDLLISDVVMPLMNGPMVAEQIEAGGHGGIKCWLSAQMGQIVNRDFELISRAL